MKQPERPFQGCEFTLEEYTDALIRAGHKVYTLENLEEWPEPERSQMKAVLASASKELADRIEADALEAILKQYATSAEGVNPQAIQ